MDKINEITQKKVLTINDNTIGDKTAAMSMLYRFIELKSPGKEEELKIYMKNLPNENLSELREIIIQSYLSYIEEYHNLPIEEQALKCLCYCPLLKNLVFVNRQLYIKNGEADQEDELLLTEVN
jgi:hypothetical protein